MEIAASKEAQEGRRAMKYDKKSNKKAKRKAMGVATGAQADSKRIVQSNPHIAEQSISHIAKEPKGENGVIALANESSESDIISTPGRESDISVVRVEHAFVTQSPPSNPINTEGVVDDVTNDHHNEPQTTISNRRGDGMETSKLDDHAGKKEEENEEEDSDDSMDYFPDIVDEDPDEEDRVN
jgi:hypothetical protein